MNYDTAIKARNRIISYLNADGVDRRAPRSRFAIGLTPTFQVAVRAPSQKDFDRALGKGASDEIKDMAEGELDVQFTGAITAERPAVAASTGPLKIGTSVGHYKTTAGTLGFFARRVSDRNVVGFVSNNHVLANFDQGAAGDNILYPGPLDGGEDVIAHLADGYPKLDNNTVVDAAFARLREGVSYDAMTIAPGLTLNPEPVPLFRQREVLKVGRSTGLTRGRISAFALQNLFVEYPSLDNKKIIFNRQIEIVADEGERFSSSGDSGSLVVNPEGHPIGLLFSCNSYGRYAYANPIDEVLHELQVEFLV